ncbi:Uncharacterised protein [Mycoplasmopsis caviae]|uniref:Uncharacterized protein n=1 Tax=Mycoplasmopsis caviae TaxID=55603 RepID=A0A3P8LAK8_9BACT|nr:Uncharacterised protein [Mycoplasmopsis caviae]
MQKCECNLMVKCQLAMLIMGVRFPSRVSELDTLKRLNFWQKAQKTLIFRHFLSFFSKTCYMHLITLFPLLLTEKELITFNYFVVLFNLSAHFNLKIVKVLLKLLPKFYQYAYFIGKLFIFLIFNSESRDKNWRKNQKVHFCSKKSQKINFFIFAIK